MTKILKAPAKINRVMDKERKSTKQSKRLRENIGQGNGFVFSDKIDSWMSGDHQVTRKYKPLF
jgi:hypothetical protein